jgi:hypothetical protein
MTDDAKSTSAADALTGSQRQTIAVLKRAVGVGL